MMFDLPRLHISSVKAGKSYSSSCLLQGLHLALQCTRDTGQRVFSGPCCTQHPRTYSNRLTCIKAHVEVARGERRLGGGHAKLQARRAVRMAIPHALAVQRQQRHKCCDLQTLMAQPAVTAFAAMHAADTCVRCRCSTSSTCVLPPQHACVSGLHTWSTKSAATAEAATMAKLRTAGTDVAAAIANASTSDRLASAMLGPATCRSGTILHIHCCMRQ